MSVNDWVNTSLGGAAVGVVFYRTSSMILDNEATGLGRFGREAAAFELNPNRGFTRLVSGNARRVYTNPAHPSDHIPERIEAVISTGIRVPSTLRTARGGELDEGYPNHGYLNLRLISGSLADLNHGRPYDYYSLSTQINLVNGRGLGEIRIQGNLWQTELGRSDNSVSRFVAGQGSDHVLQTLRVRGLLPVLRGFGVGVDYELFDRRSDFEFDELGLVKQRTNQWQFFVSWNPILRARA